MRMQKSASYRQRDSHGKANGRARSSALWRQMVNEDRPPYTAGRPGRLVAHRDGVRLYQKSGRQFLEGERPQL
ncbi:unnamed protein product [Soboliphyme baturini]|uniref:Integrase n=1 Tax=Soboliphyme baturini TaxID=241478 RepID=A0A183IIK1_9BILA|nr:unnamed protein product [Soboliphyme baturini]